jgi:Type I phosphodiesterase / nucleotide pyrophosphatase
MDQSRRHKTIRHLRGGMILRFGAALCGAFSALLTSLLHAPASAQALDQRNIIIFVWDGLRPDSVTAKDTPNLYAMREAGVNFTDNHSTYPTFTMMNAASFATGSFSGTTGYYDNCGSRARLVMILRESRSISSNRSSPKTTRSSRI